MNQCIHHFLTKKFIIVNDRKWIHSNMEKIVNTNEYMKFNNNFCNYGTVLYNTKGFLKVIKDTNNETTNY